MDVEINGYEILEIAEKIELNGVKFYRRAAEICDDARASALFVELAHWETRHVEIFSRMKDQWAEEKCRPGSSSSNGLGCFDPHCLAGLAVFAIQPDPASELATDTSRGDVLKMAIENEKESVVYYSGLRAFVPHEKDRKAIDDIIQEEMKHIRILMQMLEQKK